MSHLLVCQLKLCGSQLNKFINWSVGDGCLTALGVGCHMCHMCDNQPLQVEKCCFSAEDMQTVIFCIFCWQKGQELQEKDRPGKYTSRHYAFGCEAGVVHCCSLPYLFENIRHVGYPLRWCEVFYVLCMLFVVANQATCSYRFV